MNSFADSDSSLSFTLNLDDELFLYQIENKLAEWSQGKSIYLQEVNLFYSFILKFLIDILHVQAHKLAQLNPLRAVQRSNFQTGIQHLKQIKSKNIQKTIESCIYLAQLFDGTRNEVLAHIQKQK